MFLDLSKHTKKNNFKEERTAIAAAETKKVWARSGNLKETFVIIMTTQAGDGKAQAVNNTASAQVYNNIHEFKTQHSYKTRWYLTSEM